MADPYEKFPNWFKAAYLTPKKAEATASRGADPEPAAPAPAPAPAPASAARYTLLRHKPLEYLSPTKAFTFNENDEVNVKELNENDEVTSIANLYNKGRRGLTSLVTGISLRHSPSIGTQEANNRYKERRRKATEERNRAYGNTIAVTDEMMAQIVDVLTPCPIGPYATRVFRQHEGMGLCWHDSLFIMIFENQYTKPMMLQLVKDFLFELNTRKYAGLKYDTVQLHNIALALRRKHAPKLSIRIWEMVALALLRYIMEAVLMIKEPPKETALVKSRLTNRRPSIGEGRFDELHEYFKTGRTYCSEEGADKASIKNFMYSATLFLDEMTQGSLQLRLLTSPSKPSKRIGYYFSIQKLEVEKNNYYFRGNAHILSLFLCDDTWFLYDNETGVSPLSPEQTAAIRDIGIRSIKMKRNSKVYIYEMTLEDETTLEAQMPHLHPDLGNEVEMLLEHTVPDASYTLIKDDETTTAHPAGSGAGAGAGNGVAVVAKAGNANSVPSVALARSSASHMGGRRTRTRNRRKRGHTKKLKRGRSKK